MNYVAVVVAIAESGDIALLVTVLGPFPNRDAAVKAGLTEADRRNKDATDATEYGYDVLPLAP